MQSAVALSVSRSKCQLSFEIIKHMSTIRCENLAEYQEHVHQLVIFCFLITRLVDYEWIV